jgi:SAM-dependent methyltransferase
VRRAWLIIRLLSRAPGHRTSASVSLLFDPMLRARRRDRAARSGVELFLLERAFADCLERISLVQQSFRKALLIGCPDPDWPRRLQAVVDAVDARDPGALFAQAGGGGVIVEDDWSPPEPSYDLVLAVGTLDTVNDLSRAIRSVRQSLHSGGLFIGAVSGGDTLPQLRSAMREADRASGEASPHVHPRIEASALAPLLSAAGLQMPVVDVDRVQVGYRSFDRLVADLRAMAATNVLAARSRRPLTRSALQAARDSFAAAGSQGRTVETFEILHFAAWCGSGEPTATAMSPR